jgi:hypothetical protein
MQPQLFNFCDRAIVLLYLNETWGAVSDKMTTPQPLITPLDWQRRIQEMQGSGPLSPLWDTVRLDNRSR